MSGRPKSGPRDKRQILLLQQPLTEIGIVFNTDQSDSLFDVRKGVESAFGRPTFDTRKSVKSMVNVIVTILKQRTHLGDGALVAV